MHDITRGTVRIMVFKVLVNGALLCMKEIQSMSEKTSEREIKMYRSIPRHDNLAYFVGAVTKKTEALLFLTLYDTSLEDLIEDVVPPSVSTCVEILRQSALGLRHLHINGFIHRDIKPGNIFLFLDQKTSRVISAHIGDLDFAIRMCDGPTSEIIGTVGYIAPEVLRQDNYSYEADIYSFGMTIYHLITGEYPYNNLSTREQINEAVLASVAPNPTKPIHNKYNDLWDLYLAATEYEPKDRITIDDLIARLIELA